MRKAIGGDPSSSAASLVETGLQQADENTGRYVETTDLNTGDLVDDENGPVVSTKSVYVGPITFRRDLSGGVHAVDAIGARLGNLTDAYVRRYGYFHSHAGRDVADLRCNIESSSGLDYYVISITPEAGQTSYLWVDPKSALLAKTVRRTPTSVLTRTFSDYRQVDKYVVPFIIRTSAGFSSSERNVGSYRFTSNRLSRAVFERPPEIGRVRMAENASSSAIPLRVEDGKLLVEATVAGRRLLFQLDTGGHAILTREAATKLGLKLRGSGRSGGGGESSTALQYSQPQSLIVGKAHFPPFPFFVLTYDRSFSDRGLHKAPIAGILGLEIFERLAARIDYANRLLTLTPLHSFRKTGKTSTLPIEFEDDVPLVSARADDFVGRFQLDTGNSGGTIVFGPFARNGRFDQRYASGYRASGIGTGGVVSLVTRRVKRFKLDGLLFKNYITYFVNQRTGSFSSTTVAGNIGFDVLSHFVTTLDFSHGAAYLEPLRRAPNQTYSRLGLVTKRDRGKLFVETVLRNSPASEASIAAGDEITRINSRDARSITVDVFRAMARGPIGSIVRLHLRRRHRERAVSLKLKDLLCTNHSESCSATVVNP